ncbi:MAG: hypothetical protein OXI37_08995 [Gammaproteobacteria bacterium]|nr:hypothetical protein [Gammaproteobacteria bacterium]
MSSCLAPDSSEYVVNDTGSRSAGTAVYFQKVLRWCRSHAAHTHESRHAPVVTRPAKTDA